MPAQKASHGFGCEVERNESDARIRGAHRRRLWHTVGRAPRQRLWQTRSVLAVLISTAEALELRECPLAEFVASNQACSMATPVAAHIVC